MLGADVFNGTQTQLRGFGNQIGATFPLLLNASLSTGGNFYSLYGDRDVWVVINKTGIVRYSSYVLYSYPNRYNLDDITGTIDSLVSSPLDVPAGGPGALSLRAAPNPFAAYTLVEFTHPGPAARATVAVHDLQGRRVATLWDGEAPVGVTRVAWDGRATNGARAAPGVYVLRAEVGGKSLSRRVTRIE